MNKYRQQKHILEQQKSKDILRIHTETQEKEGCVYEQYSRSLSLLQSECPHVNKKKVTDYDYHNNDETITTFCEDCGAKLKRTYG